MSGVSKVSKVYASDEVYASEVYASGRDWYFEEKRGDGDGDGDGPKSASFENPTISVCPRFPHQKTDLVIVPDGSFHLLP